MSIAANDLQAVPGPDIPHIDCATAATISTVAASCGGDPSFVGYAALPVPFSGAVGAISLVGDVGWSLMLALPPETAVMLALKFCGFEIEYDSDDMSDVVGELVNVLAGDVLARLEAAGVNANMSLPTVTRGADMKMSLPEVAYLVNARFTSEEGEFWLTVGVAEVD